MGLLAATLASVPPASAEGGSDLAVIQTLVFEGYIKCGASTILVTFAPCSDQCVDELGVCSGPVHPQDRSELEFELGGGAETLLIEMDWESRGTNATGAGRLVMIVDGCREDARCAEWGRASGDAPLSYRTESPYRLDFTGTRQMKVLAYPNWELIPQVLLDQPFTLYVTTAYGERLPAGYSAIPG